MIALGCAGSVTVIGAKSGTGEPCSNSDRIYGIHLHTIALGKSINPDILRHGLNSRVDGIL